MLTGVRTRRIIIAPPYVVRTHRDRRTSKDLTQEIYSFFRRTVRRQLVGHVSVRFELFLGKYAVSDSKRRGSIKDDLFSQKKKESNSSKSFLVESSSLNSRRLRFSGHYGTALTDYIRRKRTIHRIWLLLPQILIAHPLLADGGGAVGFAFIRPAIIHRTFCFERTQNTTRRRDSDRKRNGIRKHVSLGDLVRDISTSTETTKTPKRPPNPTLALLRNFHVGDAVLPCKARPAYFIFSLIT